MAEAVRVVLRCRPPRSELLKGRGQGGDEIRPSKQSITSGRKSTSAVNSRRSSGVPQSINQSGNQSNQSSGELGLKFHPDGKSVSVVEPSFNPTVKPKPHLFTFDQVIDQSTNQSTCFDLVAKNTVRDVLKGYNGSIFAYGQSGSGKTHVS